MKYLEAIHRADLTDLQRRYVTLCVIQGHSIRTAALAHDVSPSTVRGHIDAGLKKLKPYMNQEAA